jgi:outer membrane protein assembly factor BamE
MKFKVLSILSLCGVLLQGCATNRLPTAADLPSMGSLPSVGSLPFVHKIDVQQGNVITQDMIAQLQLGMDKKKVNFVMGSPIIMDTFHANRWDYLYTISERGGRPKRRRITLFFENDVLVRVDGDVKAAEGRIVVDTRQDMTVDVPKPEKKGVVGTIVNTIPFVGEEKPKVRKPAKTTSLVEDSAPPGADQAPAKPQITPVERAAIEEKGGPGMFSKLKDAVPFTGSSAPETAEVIEMDEEDAVDEVVDETVTELEEAEPDEETPEEESDGPGLLDTITGALPFVGADEAESEEMEREEETPEEMPEVRDAPEEEQPEEDDEGEAWDWESRYDDDNVISAPPPGAPTPMPLEDRLSEEAYEDEEDAEQGDSADEDKEDKPGFFKRLFGRD